ncbi:hypothetical protein BDC45DRAFT_75419 [Circinella umbellata]|nr:hypothetical protein BDC45DRAFT_75419 [Circinella umbellata]
MLFSTFALLYFQNRTKAATFYYIYTKQKNSLCKRLPNVVVNPSLCNNIPIRYIKLTVQPQISPSSSMCKCYSNNNNNNDNNNNNENINSNDDNANTNTNINDDNNINDNNDNNNNNENINSNDEDINNNNIKQ